MEGGIVGLSKDKELHPHIFGQQRIYISSYTAYIV